MSARLMHQVRESRLGSPAEKLVLVMLASYADDDGGRVYPSMSRLAGDCCMSRRGVQKIADRLVASGVLVRVRDGGKGPGSTNEYRVNIATLERLVNRDKREPRSHIDNGKVRTGFTHGGDLSANGVPISANLSADKCEPGSPDSSLTLQDTGSADAPELTPAQKLFGGCRQYLEAFDIAPAAARKLLGKWKREIGDDTETLVGIIARCKATEAVDPVPWITAAIAKRKANGTGGNPTPSRRVPDRIY